MHGKVVEVKPQALHKRKEHRGTYALDSDQQTIQRNDIVKVIDGPHSVKNENSTSRTSRSTNVIPRFFFSSFYRVAEAK